MRKVILLGLLALPLAGCGDGAQRRQALAQCDLDTRAHYPGPQTGTFFDTNYVFLNRCMASKGFVSDPKLCLKKSDFTWLGDADCYRRDDWWDELGAKIKARLDSD